MPRLSFCDRLCCFALLDAHTDQTVKNVDFGRRAAATYGGLLDFAARRLAKRQNSSERNVRLVRGEFTRSTRTARKREREREMEIRNVHRRIRAFQAAQKSRDADDDLAAAIELSASRAEQ